MCIRVYFERRGKPSIHFAVPYTNISCGTKRQKSFNKKNYKNTAELIQAIQAFYNGHNRPCCDDCQYGFGHFYSGSCKPIMNRINALELYPN
jgi:hypothetical protein